MFSNKSIRKSPFSIGCNTLGRRTCPRKANELLRRRSGISEGACGDTETVGMDLEGIGIGADGMSGDSNDISFVVALIIVGSSSSHRNFYSFRKFLLTSFCRTLDYVLLTFPRRWVFFSLITEQETFRALQTPSGSLVIPSIGSHHQQTLMMQP